ncbi:MAG: Gfo/Idh/MocA family oxidoreductase [Candidatus Hodarchaeales archaeon]
MNGEDGTIRINPTNQVIIKNTELDGPEPAFETMDQLPYFVEQVSSFASAIIKGESVPVPCEDGFTALRIAQAALKSLQNKKAVQIR